MFILNEDIHLQAAHWKADKFSQNRNVILLVMGDIQGFRACIEKEKNIL